MTPQDIMEELSIKYIEIIANNKGYYDLSGKDYGTDLHITYAVKDNGRFRKSGRIIDIQLKSAMERNCIDTEKTIKYKLEVKNYNDLISRKNEENYIPLILILFIFPNDPKDWLQVDSEKLILRKCAYWYYPAAHLELTTNLSKKMIEISKSNLITVDFFPDIFEAFKYGTVNTSKYG